MNIFKHNFKLLVLSLFAFQGFSNAALADDHLHAVSGSVTGCSNKHACMSLFMKNQALTME